MLFSNSLFRALSGPRPPSRSYSSEMGSQDNFMTDRLRKKTFFEAIKTKNVVFVKVQMPTKFEGGGVNPCGRTIRDGFFCGSPNPGGIKDREREIYIQS